MTIEAVNPRTNVCTRLYDLINVNTTMNFKKDKYEMYVRFNKKSCDFLKTKKATHIRVFIDDKKCIYARIIGYFCNYSDTEATIIGEFNLMEV